jgi:hypothetical protein
MRFSEIPKFVINLDRRTDRMEMIQKEMDYLGWEFERFSAIDRNSYMGCTLSTLEVIKIAKERGYDRVMIIEDDCSVMPYANDLLSKIEHECKDLEFAVMNLSPTLNRPVNVSDRYKLLLDITNTPEAPSYCRGIYATNMVVYDKSIYDKLNDIALTAFTSGDYYFSIDDFIYTFIMKNYQSYSPILPIAPQRLEYSNVSDGVYNNWYTQTYNWNNWGPIKIPSKYLDHNVVQDLINKKEYHKLEYEN